MTETECITCRKPKASHVCECCGEAVCKKCRLFLDPKTFSFLKELPEPLRHGHYCGSCYDEHVTPALESYEEIMSRAKEAFVFFKTQRKEVPLFKKSKEIYRVLESPDRDETILHLAFQAAQEGYNAVIDVEVNAEKVRNGAYQTSKWSGSGVGAEVDGAKIDRQDLLDKMYR